eukprot:TRINITY_DN14624_c0_g3_i2.p1 TRINITY_DN14624_c0_g3~~TRINITY_DN14624_c0_g3_i2.p1  ORF type:complete len:517 (+),score=61.71 TRINITY_DN14624_c0_g3_i2:165-1553(+)
MAALIIGFGTSMTILARGDPRAEEVFPTIGATTLVLVLQGTLLDDISEVMLPWVEHRQDLAVLLLTYIFLSSFTVLNMLIGVIVDVVGKTKSREKDRQRIRSLQCALFDILESHDGDDDGCINENEYDLLLKNPEAQSILRAHGVSMASLNVIKPIVFDQAKGDHLLRFSSFVNLIVRLRGSNATTVSDLVHLREYLKQRCDAMDERLAELHGVGEDPRTAFRSATANGQQSTRDSSVFPTIQTYSEDGLPAENDDNSDVDSTGTRKSADPNVHTESRGLDLPPPECTSKSADPNVHTESRGLDLPPPECTSKSADPNVHTESRGLDLPPPECIAELADPNGHMASRGWVSSGLPGVEGDKLPPVSSSPAVKTEGVPSGLTGVEGDALSIVSSSSSIKPRCSQPKSTVVEGGPPRWAMSLISQVNGLVESHHELRNEVRSIRREAKDFQQPCTIGSLPHTIC